MKKVKGISLVMLTIFVLVTLISIPSCKKQEEKVIKIGAILPLTGDLAKYGEAQKRGIEIFFEEEPNSHNFFSVYFNDNSSDKNRSLSVYRYLKTTKDINAVYTVGSSISMALLPVLRKDQVMFIAVAATDDVLKDRTKYIYKNFPSSSCFMKSLADVIIKKERGKQGILMYINDDFGKNLSENLKIWLHNPVKLIKSISFNQDIRTYRDIALKAMDYHPDFLVILGYGQYLGNIVRFIREIGFKGEIYTTLEIAYKDAIDALRGHYNNLYFMDVDLFNQNFEKKYKKNYNSKPNLDAYIGYYTFKILNNCIKKNKPKNINELVDFLDNYEDNDLNIKIVNGLFIYPSSLYTLDSNGNKMKLNKKGT